MTLEEQGQEYRAAGAVLAASFACRDFSSINFAVSKSQHTHTYIYIYIYIYFMKIYEVYV